MTVRVPARPSPTNPRDRDRSAHGNRKLKLRVPWCAQSHDERAFTPVPEDTWVPGRSNGRLVADQPTQTQVILVRTNVGWGAMGGICDEEIECVLVYKRAISFKAWAALSLQ